MLDQILLMDVLDLFRCDLVQPGFDDAECEVERPRSIDDEEFAHAFGVPVLANGCRCLNVLFDIVEFAYLDTVQIEDRAGCFHRVTNCLRAGRETLVNEFLVLVNQPLELAVHGGNAVEAVEVERTQSLDIYRPTLLDIPITSDQVANALTKTYLVSLVVALRVILINLCLLFEVKIPRR